MTGYYQTAAAETRNQRIQSENAMTDERNRRNSEQNNGDTAVSRMMMKALIDGYKQSQKIAQEKKKEYSALRPPYETKHSQAKEFISGKTLYMESSAPIWFDPNGYATSIDQYGTPKSFKWLVKSDTVCMGNNAHNRNCMRFFFNKKNTRIQTSSGSVINTFQLLSADIENFSKYTQKRHVAQTKNRGVRK